MRLLFIVIAAYPFAVSALTTADLATAPPANLINGVRAACRTGNYEKIASWHSKRIEALLLVAPDRALVTSVYCTQVEQLIERLGGDAGTANYFIRQNPDTPKKFELCMAPRTAAGTCKMHFDVIIEGGQLKKDEL